MLAQKRNATDNRTRNPQWHSCGWFWVLLWVAMGLPAWSQSDPVYVNQVGYPVAGAKIAVVSSPVMVPFSVLNLDSRQMVLSSQLRLGEANDAASGAQLWLADFSVIDATGSYLVRVPGIGTSFPFRIDLAPYRDAFQDAAGFFYGMRYGLELTADLAGDLARPSPSFGLTTVYESPASATPEQVAIGGGWREGSDPNQYTPTGAYAAGWLLTLQETFPGLLGDGALSIPENANGWPDLLDEAQWQLIWLLQMQRDDGGLYHKQAHPGNQTVAVDGEAAEERVVYPPATASTAAACAVFAKASRLVSPHDATFALTCRQAALRAWHFLEANPDNRPFENPEGVLTKSYSDPDDSDERLWAALELYLATDDEAFSDILMARVEDRIPLIAAAGYWGNPMSMVAATVMANATNEWDESFLDELTGDVILLADTFVERSRSDGFRVSLRDDRYAWGSNASLVQNAILVALAHRATGDPEYLQVVQDQVSAILGRNPLNQSYVVGSGSNPPETPFQNLTQNDEPLPPWPGTLVGGPNPGLNDAVLKGRFGAGTPPALCYVDSPESYASNEYSIEWNAAWLYLLATLVAPVN